MDLYSCFACISGIQLNVQKTEIVIVGVDDDERIVNFNITYNDTVYNITSQESVKITGLTFSYDKQIGHEKNVTNQIDKLEDIINKWKCRNLTLGGR